MTANAEPVAKPYRELTVAAVVFGVAIGALMTAAFVYIALKLGFSMPGSTVAAILGFAVLRGMLHRGSIVENNLNQTVASGVNNASAGITFTLPALFIMGAANPELAGFNPIAALLAALAGSFLGIVVIIPLRKQMIEFDRLRFPSGIAVASLLRSPGAGPRQAKLLAGGFFVAAVLHVPAYYELIPTELAVGDWIGLPAWLPLSLGVSFASIGAGLLAGRGGLPFILGGMLAWWVISPLAINLGWVPSLASLDLPAADAAAGELSRNWQDWASGVLYAQMLRPLGIGVLIGGALAGVVVSLPALRAAFVGLSQASSVPGAMQELSPRFLYLGIVGSMLVLFLAAVFADPEMTLAGGALTAVVGTLWLALAGLVVAQATGMTDLSPISGMSLIGVTIMFFLTNGNVATSIILGVAVSIGIGQCADMMSDLKAGHLTGARPRLQQIAQFSFAWIGVPVAIGVLYLIWNGPGFGPSNPDLSAPQGTALAAVMEGLRDGAAPVDKYITGIGVGLAMGIYPLSGMGVLVGLAMYLPFYITLTYGVGCFASMALEARRGSAWVGTTVIPVAAGFIIGEALVNLTLTLATLVSES
ncbi:MAG: OPT/YSL family transporter [Pseudomonadales bacterium]